MPSLFDAMAKAGLATRDEQLAREIDEAQRLRDQHETYLTKTLEDLASRSDFDFFGKVEWLIDIYLGPEYPEQRIIEVQNFVEKHMLGGDAGRQFLQQIKNLRAGTIGIHELKAKWPKIWKP